MTTLSAHEMRFARLFIAGKSYKQIAIALGRTEKAVSCTSTRVREKCGTRNRLELLHMMSRDEIVSNGREGAPA